VVQFNVSDVSPGSGGLVVHNYAIRELSAQVSIPPEQSVLLRPGDLKRHKFLAEPSPSLNSMELCSVSTWMKSARDIKSPLEEVYSPE